jgi:hypothetical protein
LSEKYDSDVQELLICMMLSDPELFVRCSNIVSPTYFDKKLVQSVGFIKSYSEKHNGLPSPKIVNAKYKTDFEQVEMNESHKDWFLDTIEGFCKRKAMEQAIHKGSEMLEKGEYGDLEKLIKDATLVSLQREMGTDYFADPRKRLEKLKEQNGNLSTGWKTVDEIVYQIGFGELVLFTAISGGGKSVAMQNITLNFALSGLNVIYITLELSEELVAKRIDAMLTGVSNINIFKDIDNVVLKVKDASKRSGNIFIKYMDPGSTPNDLKAYIREFTIQNGFKPDAVVVDYMDLMHPNQKRVDLSNLFVKDKLVAESLRGLASPDQFNMICVSACQVNRCLTPDTLVIKNGKDIRLDALSVGDWIESSEGPVRVDAIHPQTTQPVFKIKTKSGKIIECSGKHEFPTYTGLKSLETGLNIGDMLFAVNDIVDEIVNIDFMGNQPTMDIEVSGNRLFYANKILTHNSGYTETVPGMESMAGGISKAYTSDLAINIHNTSQLRERGEIEFQMIKTRNSGGVGKSVTLQYDVETLRITDMPTQSQSSSTSSGSSSGETSSSDNLKNLLSKIKKK